MNEPIKRYVVVDDTEYVKCIMEIPGKSQLRTNAELRGLYLDFIDPTVDEGECLERMARFINKFKNKPSKELELR